MRERELENSYEDKEVEDIIDTYARLMGMDYEAARILSTLMGLDYLREEIEEAKEVENEGRLQED